MSILISILDFPININDLIKWETKFGAAKCCYCNENINLVGRHIKKLMFDQNNIYIIPLCESHKNELNGGIYVNEKTNFF